MNLGVIRMKFTSKSTTGMLYLDDAFFCFTLEPVTLGEGSEVKPRAIPVGRYRLTLRHSPRFGKIMPHVEVVKGFEGILIHVGNFPKDTEGCLLVGYGRQNEDFVGRSIAAFGDLMRKLQAAEAAGQENFITYTEETNAHHVNT
jgi:hypothetical protein